MYGNNYRAVSTQALNRITHHVGLSPTGDLPNIKHLFNTSLMVKSRTPKRRTSPALRRPGRPATDDSADIKAGLLQSARELFLKHGFANVSSRQIAAAARTTPAMIHYYFEDKHGLFREIVAQAMAPFITTLSGALVEGAAQPIEPAALLRANIRMGAANPWLASLLVNEVFAEGGKLRADFIRDFAARLAPLLIGALEAARDRGTLRGDLDLKFTALSFMSLCAFPLIARAITQLVLGVRLEGADLDRLIEHTIHLFMHGCAAQTARAETQVTGKQRR